MKFESQWGGEDTWYTKSKRWANEDKPIIKSTASEVEGLDIISISTTNEFNSSST